MNVAGGSFVRQVRAGKVPIFSGTAVFSFTHADDTATAVAAALDKDANGVLNIVGHEPGRMTSCPRPSCSNACTRWA